MNIFGQGKVQPSSDEAPLGAVENDRTGRYWRYDKILGRGAFKTVYKAFDVTEGLEVAWNKVILGCAVNDDTNRKRLFYEITVLKRLKHKNIMTFYDSWLDENSQTLNFITELFTDGSLKKFRVRHKHLELNVLKKWAWKILQGLVYLHGHDPPIIHRDLKCDNIFINGVSGDLKIGDLGLATLWKGMTAPQSVLGTPEFMAPEYYNEKYDEKVDVYAFGMLLLELVTMEYPYCECTNPAAIYKKVTDGILPESLNKVRTKELYEFIVLCIAHDPKQRPEARKLLKHPFFDRIRREMEPKRTSSGEFERISNFNSKEGNQNNIVESEMEESEMSEKFSSYDISHNLSEKEESPSIVSEKNTSTMSVHSETQDFKEEYYHEEDKESIMHSPLISRTAENFVVECKKQEGGSILIFKIKFRDLEGNQKAVQFPFDMKDDTAEQVVAEMLEENASINLPITDDEAGIIGRLIAKEVENYQNDLRVHVNISRTDTETETIHPSQSICAENSNMIQTLCSKVDDVLYDVSTSYHEEEEVLKTLSLRSSDILDIVSGQDICARSPMRIIPEDEVRLQEPFDKALPESMEGNAEHRRRGGFFWNDTDINEKSSLPLSPKENSISKMCKSPSVDVPKERRRSFVCSAPDSPFNACDKSISSYSITEWYNHENSKLDSSSSLLAKSLGRCFSKSNSVSESPSGLIVSYRREVSPQLHATSEAESPIFCKESAFHHQLEKVPVPRSVSVFLLDNTNNYSDVSDINSSNVKKKGILKDRNMKAVPVQRSASYNAYECLPGTSVISMLTMSPVKEIPSEEDPSRKKLKKLNIEDAKQKVDSWSKSLANEPLTADGSLIESSSNNKPEIISNERGTDSLKISSPSCCSTHSRGSLADAHITNISSYSEKNLLSNNTDKKEEVPFDKGRLNCKCIDKILSPLHREGVDRDVCSPVGMISARYVETQQQEGNNRGQTKINIANAKSIKCINPFDELFQERIKIHSNAIHEPFSSSEVSEQVQCLPPLPLTRTSSESKNPIITGSQKQINCINMRGIGNRVCDSAVNLEHGSKVYVENREHSDNAMLLSRSDSAYSDFMTDTSKNDNVDNVASEINSFSDMSASVLKNLSKSTDLGYKQLSESETTRSDEKGKETIMGQVSSATILSSEAYHNLNRMFKSCSDFVGLFDSQHDGHNKGHNSNPKSKSFGNNSNTKYKCNGFFEEEFLLNGESSNFTICNNMNIQNNLECHKTAKEDENCKNKSQKCYTFDDNAFFPNISDRDLFEKEREGNSGGDGGSFIIKKEVLTGSHMFSSPPSSVCGIMEGGQRTPVPLADSRSSSSDEVSAGNMIEKKNKIKEKRRRQAAESIDKMQELQLEMLRSDFIVTAGKVGKPSTKPNKYGTR